MHDLFNVCDKYITKKLNNSIDKYYIYDNGENCFIYNLTSDLIEALDNLVIDIEESPIILIIDLFSNNIVFSKRNEELSFEDFLPLKNQKNMSYIDKRFILTKFKQFVLHKIDTAEVPNASEEDNDKAIVDVCLKLIDDMLYFKNRPLIELCKYIQLTRVEIQELFNKDNYKED